jgi:PAS domain S-box-containing protein
VEPYTPWPPCREAGFIESPARGRRSSEMRPHRRTPGPSVFCAERVMPDVPLDGGLPPEVSVDQGGPCPWRYRGEGSEGENPDELEVDGPLWLHPDDITHAKGPQTFLSDSPASFGVADPDEIGDIGEIGELRILASLVSIAEMIGGLSDTNELMELLARVTPGLVRVDRCAIMAYDDASREFRTLAAFARGTERTAFDGLRIQESEIPWLSQRLITLRLPALLKAASGDAGLSPALQGRLAMKAALVVPLAARGHFLGLLWLDDTRSPHYFTSEEINIAQGVGAQVAIALDRANLADHLDLERRRAESLVAALLDGLIVVDHEERIVAIDPGAEALVGWQTEEVRGRRLREVFDLSEAEASVAWRTDRSGPASGPKELALRARDGHTVVCRAQGIPVRDDKRAVVQVLYVLWRQSGTKGYWERALESTDRLANVQATDLPE